MSRPLLPTANGSLDLASTYTYKHWYRVQAATTKKTTSVARRRRRRIWYTDSSPGRQTSQSSLAMPRPWLHSGLKSTLTHAPTCVARLWSCLRTFFLSLSLALSPSLSPLWVFLKFELRFSVPPRFELQSQRQMSSRAFPMWNHALPPAFPCPTHYHLPGVCVCVCVNCIKMFVIAMQLETLSSRANLRTFKNAIDAAEWRTRFVS